VRYFKGHPKRPLSDAEVEAKFRGLAEASLGKKRADAVLAAAWKLEKLKNVGDLLKLLKFGGAKRRPKAGKK
jgi:2-methylcitrate dehydratase